MADVAVLSNKNGPYRSLGWVRQTGWSASPSSTTVSKRAACNFRLLSDMVCAGVRRCHEPFEPIDHQTKLISDVAGNQETIENANKKDGKR